MFYYTVDYLGVNEVGKKELITVKIENEDIIKAKKNAELYYISKMFEGYSPTLGFENEDDYYSLSESNTTENAKLEARYLTRLSGKRQKPIFWEIRYSRIYNHYTKAKA